MPAGLWGWSAHWVPSLFLHTEEQADELHRPSSLGLLPEISINSPALSRQ